MEISRVDAAIDHAVSEIAKTDAAIEQVREDYLSLIVSSPQDQAGYQSAETALKKMVRIRTTVEKTRKALKADSVRYGKAVDGEAKRIREAIEPIEEHLKTQCDIVRLEEARQAVAAENARRDEVNGWVEQLKEFDRASKAATKRRSEKRPELPRKICGRAAHPESLPSLRRAGPGNS